jgi:serine/threonine-protein kinase
MNHLSLARWKQIDALFEEALERPADERTAFLRYHCGEDPELYDEVVSLLESEAEAEMALGESATVFAAPLMPELEIDLAGGADDDRFDEYDDQLKRVGPYRVVRAIGRGGMGAVYLASRDGEDFEQQVALKLVKRGMDTDEILRRFRHERRILASLNHPNIARLYDGGVTDDGRPYLTMEYIAGAPIDRYCDSRKLSIDDRLKLFMPVCAAVQYAHQNLVVHRDLKPSNILVTEDASGNPRIKLLDFGISKLLESDAAASTPLTRAGVRVMTPAYAAPEQMIGTPVTTATDVYALGVVLYELLTGHLPRETNGLNGGGDDQIRHHHEPERPSVAVERMRRRRNGDAPDDEETPFQLAALRSANPERLRRQLRGDLDTILLRALRKEPERRYVSAEQFAEDIRRHVAGLPVQARPDTLGYRSRKFVQRHYVGVAAAAAFVLLLVGFAVVMMLQQAATARARDAAEMERDKAERVVQVFTEMLQSADPAQARGDTLTVVEVLAQSSQRIDTALVHQPEVQGKMYNVLGRVYQSLGEYGPSQDMLEKALSVRQVALETPHPDLIETTTDLANLAEKTGNYAAAETYHLEALAMRRELYGQDHPETFKNLNNLASLLYRRGDLDGAAARFNELLSANRQVFGDRDLATASVLNNLGAVLKRMEDFDGAAPLLREALETYRVLLGSDHPLALSTLANLGSLLSDSGDLGEAETLFRSLLTTRIGILGEDHPDVAATLTGLALTLQRQGEYEEAEVHFRRALDINTQALGPDHPSVGMDLSTLAAMLQENGAAEEPARLYAEALEIFRAKFPPEHPAIAYPLVNWGRLLVDQGAFQDALPLLREGFELRSAGFGPGYWGTAQAQGALGASLAGLHRFDEAEPLLTDSYQMLLADRGPADNRTESVRRYLYQLYDAWNKPEEAVKYRSTE